MNQAQEMNTFDQENNGILENQYYENFEWLHKQDSILENLLRQKQESTWIRNHQNQSVNQDTEQSSERGHFKLQEQSYFDQQPKNGTPLRSEFLVNNQDQLMNQQNSAYFDQQPSHDIPFKPDHLINTQDPDLWVNTQDQSVESTNQRPFINMICEVTYS